jgi:hypothetical protein
MVEDKEDRSESGAPIYRHSASDARSELVGGVSQFTEVIESHIDKHFKKRGPVFHEIVSDLVHLDIELIEPTADRPYFTLITNGMSSRPMSTPKGAEQSQYAELVLSLPPDWPLTQELFANERNYWPIRWLKELARLPHKYNTWLWASHTVPNGDPPEPFADNTKLCCALILFPVLVPKSFVRLEVSPGTMIHFLSFVPIYREEMDLKLHKGLDPLMSLFDKAKVNELLNINRLNTCKRGLFR